MSALYFGPVERSLFGWFHPAAGPAKPCGVVLCYPLGWEHIRCFRGFRHLAEAFAAAGFPTLRFDYDGTGDSVGDDVDPGRVEAWHDSIGMAIAELKARSGSERIALFGARMGATLATTFAAARGGVDFLMLWNPCLSGRAYVREMRAFRRMGAQAGETPVASGAEGDEEVAGFVLTRQTLEGLAGLDLLAAGPPPAPAVLVLARDEVSPENRLVKALQERGSEVELRRIEGYAGMVVELHRAQVPHALFASAVGWLTDSWAGLGTTHGGVPVGSAAAAPTRTSAIVSPPASAPGGHATVREEAVFFGEEPRLFGIVTDPLPGTVARRTAVVLVNNGSVHRVGSNRMYVTMARSWASLGFTVLRLDLAGIGDSPPRGGRADNVLYSAGVAGEVREAMTWLRAERAVEEFVLLGLCSGAFASFHAARAGAPVRGAVLINPPVYYWKEGDSLELAQTRTYSDLQGYKQSLFRVQKWLRLVRREVSIAHLGRLLAARGRDIAAARVKAALHRLGIRGGRPSLGSDLLAIVESGISLAMVFSEGDPGLDHLDLNAGREVDRLRSRRDFRLDTIPSADHTFTSVRAQRRLIEVITSHLEHEFGAPSAAPSDRPGVASKTLSPAP